MIEELAVVVRIDNHQAWVESGRNSACGACMQKSSCTSSAIGSVLKKKPVPVDSGMPLKIGDKVIVAIDESLLLRASLLLYLLPLLALFTGAGIADWVLADNTRYKDLAVAGSALSSFLMSMRLINKAQSLWVLGACIRPVVVKKV